MTYSENWAMEWMESLFADDLAIYITTRNQRVPSRALQKVTNKQQRGDPFSLNKTVSMIIFKKKNKKPIKIMRDQIILYKENTQ